MKEIASGLRFPEGPIALDDGSVLVVEIARGTLTRIAPTGRISVIAELGGGPNGAARGPDGKIYVCNNGGFEWHDVGGGLFPGHQPADYRGGSIQRVDLDSGRVETLYTHCAGAPLRGPNDLVFDAHGGFYFSDLGKSRRDAMDHGRVFYARADGSAIALVGARFVQPNGVGLSPDGRTLYVAECLTARLWALDVTGPGTVAPGNGITQGRFLYGPGGYQMFDSMALEACGNVCIATLHHAGVTVISPEGHLVEHVPFPDILTTNICFGSRDRRTAYVTLSSTGRLVSVDWPRPGLALAGG